jgi:hypothetical protein
MAVSRPTYATREDVKKALDVKQTARNDWQIDDAIEGASDSIDGDMHRRFYTALETRYFDWPNFQATWPWTIYLDQSDVADIAGTVPVVTTGGSSPQTIPAANILWRPAKYAPPYTRLELDRSTSSAFGLGSTPQRDVHITAQFGYQDVFATGGALGAAVSDTTGTGVTVTNGAAVGVGDVILAGSERMLVTDKATVSSGQSQQGTGCSTANPADNALAVTDGTKFFTGEALQLDSERMLAVDVTGNTVTVKRAWDGTTLATHTGATVYALRQLTVVRGVNGSTAATHTNGAAVTRAVVPPLVRQLAIAYAEIDLVQQGGAYANSQGSGPSKQTGIGQGVDDLFQRCYTRHGRKARSRVV